MAMVATRGEKANNSLAMAAARGTELNERGAAGVRPRRYVIPLLTLPLLVGVYALLYPNTLNRLDQGFLGGTRGDPAIYIWLFLNNAKNVLTWPSEGFDIGIYYPFGRALAYSDNFLLPSLIGKLFLAAHIPQELAFNLIVVGVVIINGWFTFLLVWEITRNAFAALLAGIAFLGCPFIAAHLGHTQLQFACFLPATLFALDLFLKHDSLLAAVAVGLSIVFAFLSSVYYSLFTIVLVAVFLLAFIVAHRRREVFRKLFTLGAVNLPAVGVLYLLSMPYREVAEAFGLRRKGEVYPLQATLLSFASAPEENLAWGQVTAHLAHFEARFFPGVTLLILAAISLFEILVKVPRWSAVGIVFGIGGLVGGPFIDDPLTQGYVIGACLWIIVGSTLGALSAQASVKKDERQLGCLEELLIFFLIAGVGIFVSLGFLLPKGAQGVEIGLFSLLFSYVPGFQAIRAVGRFGVVVYLALTVLAGCGLALLLARLRRLPGAVIGFAVILAVLYELRATPRHIEAEPPLPGVWQRLLSLSGDTSLPAAAAPREAVLALPFGFVPKGGSLFAFMQTEYQRFSQPSNRPIMNGHSGVMPGFFHHLGPKLENFPDERSLRILREIVGLRYIVYASKFAPEFSPERFEAALRTESDELRLLERDQEGNYLLEFIPVRQLSTRAIELRFPPRTDTTRRVPFSLRARRGDGGCGEWLRANIETLARRSSAKNEEIARLDFPGDGEWHTFQTELPRSRSGVHWHTVRVDVDARPEGCEIEFRLEKDASSVISRGAPALSTHALQPRFMVAAHLRAGAYANPERVPWSAELRELREEDND